jgi:peptidyl-prolyl cis-trans isomerase A (cyclophilin A)
MSKKLLVLGLLASFAFAQAPPAAAPKPVRPDGTYAHITIVQGTAPVGEIVFKFFDKEAPLTSANFIGLANGTKPWTDPKTGKVMRKRFYDGLTFHRVIPKFMIQGGDPLGNGTGSVAVVKDEFKNGLLFDQPGRVAMAHAGPGTASCQFFITEGPTPQLNGDYTIFGQVVEGQELVAKIAGFPRDGNDRPNTTVRMTKVTIERVGAPPPRTTGTAKAATKGTATKTGTATKAPATKK